MRAAAASWVCSQPPGPQSLRRHSAGEHLRLRLAGLQPPCLQARPDLAVPRSPCHCCCCAPCCAAAGMCWRPRASGCLSGLSRGGCYAWASCCARWVTALPPSLPAGLSMPGAEAQHIMDARAVEPLLPWALRPALPWWPAGGVGALSVGLAGLAWPACRCGTRAMWRASCAPPATACRICSKRACSSSCQPGGRWGSGAAGAGDSSSAAAGRLVAGQAG